jgi:TIR domain-containing protein
MDEYFVLCKDMPMKLLKQLRIFLLHARQDEEAVHRLYRRLVREGADVWLDQEKLLPGQDWVHEIHKAIHGSDIVIACLSKQFNREGGFRHEELRIAVEKASSFPEGMIFLIPARLEKCDLPESLSRWQCVDLFAGDGYKKLIRVLKKWTEAS